MTVKCPRCKWTGSNRAYMKHFASKHYKPKGVTKAGKKIIKTAKVPIWARRRK